MTKKIIILTTLSLFTIVTACVKDVAQQPSTVNCANIQSKYGANISSIISTKCSTSGCHDGGASSAPGNFTSYATLKPYCDNGKVNNRVFITKDMPTAGMPQLSTDELNALQCWLNNGAQNN